ncbi:MAG: YbhB/YbcL family Raf kinase inhibitor-like protein [Candidatus Omnitrophota bacterium]
MNNRFFIFMGLALMVPLPAQAAEVPFSVTSPAFVDGGEIPEIYTCKGNDLNPALAWHHPPKGTKSFVIIVLSPDNPIMPWTHWLVYNISPAVRQVKVNEVPGTQALNDFGNFYFGGPCAFDAREHHFDFIVYALSSYLDDVTEGATRDVLEKAMKGKILAKAQITGVYRNPLWGADEKPL